MPDGLHMGWPLASAPADPVGANILREELPLPVCTLEDTALRANSRALPAFLAAIGAQTGADVALCPHGKTTMIPELFRRQLEDGCSAHPCTTFDKWRAVHVVADDLTVLEVLETWF